MRTAKEILDRCIHIVGQLTEGEALEAIRQAQREALEAVAKEVWGEFQKWDANRSPDVVAAVSRLVEAIRQLTTTLGDK